MTLGGGASQTSLPMRGSPILGEACVVAYAVELNQHSDLDYTATQLSYTNRGQILVVGITPSDRPYTYTE